MREHSRLSVDFMPLNLLYTILIGRLFEDSKSKILFFNFFEEEKQNQWNVIITDSLLTNNQWGLSWCVNGEIGNWMYWSRIIIALRYIICLYTADMKPNLIAYHQPLFLLDKFIMPIEWISYFVKQPHSDLRSIK